MVGGRAMTLASIHNQIANAPEWEPPKESETESAPVGPRDDDQHLSQADRLVALALDRYRLGIMDSREAFAVEREQTRVLRHHHSCRTRCVIEHRDLPDERLARRGWCADDHASAIGNAGIQRAHLHICQRIDAPRTEAIR